MLMLFKTLAPKHRVWVKVLYYNAITVGRSLLLEGDTLLDEVMEFGLAGGGSFLCRFVLSTPFSREE